MLLNGLIIILIPFLGTSLGSAVVLFSKGELNQKLQKFLLGFASGVMIAARTSIVFFERLERTPSGLSLSRCICGITLSSKSKNPIPSKNFCSDLHRE